MSHKTPVSANWEDREFVQDLQTGVLAIAGQLNRFDREVRSKLADLDVKINLLEMKIHSIDFGISEAEKSLGQDLL
eukprot:CAMPEP_0195522478 /NCGR_PEP_ID=MMETSP0794_2-20130614/20693_1 /TAXON_ID=515487 /ORGANISM="Stephanopyxis turris, Strain CCMP 815" /LENGTH=75 /DNA_ID=CAMNT_0040652243 /DNA_START=93 /DNA_END=317 /DNA_ORIENTATION=-